MTRPFSDPFGLHPDMATEPVEEFLIHLIPVDEADLEDPRPFTGLFADAITEAQELAKNAKYNVARTNILRTK